jgi:hypothetical protein
MHPPFGYALFYLRSVAATKDYVDKVTGKTLAKVTTGQIYWGAVPFVLIQLIMVGLIIAFPGLVSGGLAKKAAVNTDQIRIEIPADEGGSAPLEGSPAADDASKGGGTAGDDDAAALERELRGGKK